MKSESTVEYVKRPMTLVFHSHECKGKEISCRRSCNVKRCRKKSCIYSMYASAVALFLTLFVCMYVFVNFFFRKSFVCSRYFLAHENLLMFFDAIEPPAEQIREATALSSIHYAHKPT